MLTQDEQPPGFSKADRVSFPSGEQAAPQAPPFRHLHANLAVAFENVPSGIYLYDHLGHILVTNALGARLLGYASVEEVLQQHDLAQMRQRFYASYAVEQEDGTPLRPELGPVGRALQERRDMQLIARYIHRQSQQRFWALCRATPVFDEQGQLTNVIYSITDITPQKEAEERLREQARLLQIANDAFLVHDGDNRISFWSQGAERLYGFSAEEAVGKRGDELLHTQFPVSMAQIYSLLQTHSSWQGELLQTTKTGRVITVESRWELLKEEPSIKCLEINRDITERKEQEQRKDEFISLAGHELKTPLTSVLGYTEALQMKLARGEYPELQPYVARLATQVEKLNRLVADFLDLYRIRAGHLTFLEACVDMDALVGEVVESLQDSAPGHQVCIQGRASRPVVGDRERLGQVLVNLLSNAIKYSPNAERILVHLASTPEAVTVSVQDFGIGIAQAQQEQIFERYYRAGSGQSRLYPGLGIGLYFAQQIIERHGGKLWVESVEGQGSTFSFSLPAKDPA